MGKRTNNADDRQGVYIFPAGKRDRGLSEVYESQGEIHDFIRDDRLAEEDLMDGLESPMGAGVHYRHGGLLPTEA